MIRYLALFTLLGAASAAAQDTVVQPMAFETCVAQLATSSTGALTAPITTADTDQVKEMQYQVPDGRVTITCTRADGTVTIKHQ